ncbi:MAG: tRNA (guanine-N(1)-)-methyltransferase [Syntrophus sp. PtaB.Bin001]|nr:MAG: tRNA (guanine-N(1)-)-methyltransferase [Syntrophus sp. PtaB.Bin001]
MVRFDILSTFPEMFDSPFSCSLLKKAKEKGLIEICLHNIRDYAEDRHKMTDDAPYGGGGGMLMKVEPVDKALQSVLAGKEGVPVVLLTPQGQLFNQKIAEELSRHRQIILICGHYEGFDERIRTHLVNREISIGDFVLTGGELSAMVLVDAVSRLIPGVLGNIDSAAMDSFSSGLLEYPQYTRPSEYRGWKVPDVLLSGNHKLIDSWRRKEAFKRTWLRRPDLIKKMDLLEKDQAILRDIMGTLDPEVNDC